MTAFPSTSPDAFPEGKIYLKIVLKFYHGSLIPMELSSIHPGSLFLRVLKLLLPWCELSVQLCCINRNWVSRKGQWSPPWVCLLCALLESVSPEKPTALCPKDRQQSPATRQEARNRFSLVALGRNQPSRHLDFRPLATRPMRQ